VGLPGQERGLRPVIRGHRGEELVITAPVEPDDAAALPLGGELSLSWTGERRLRRVTVQLRERCHGDPPCRRVSVVGPPQREQRREGYRVPVMGAVELHAGGGRYEARLIDLSDGGLRGLLPTDASLPEGSSCRVALDLVRTGLRLDGVVTRVSEGVEGSCEVAVRFADVPVAVGDELRRYVFEAQRRARPSQSW
jgi:c-di-GMP-binding flagellar brake protein YcgR